MPSLNWIGKHAVVNHHKEIPFRLLKCRDDLSAGDPDSGNLLVQGDNLEALKALLPYYAGQVKCIFIDPPYNTGNEGWVYNDAVNSPEMRDWLGRVVGGESEDLSRHDKWLCMMYPRLTLLRDFLREDGAIFISIDDNEVHNLRCQLDEIFGPLNFVANVLWQKRTSPDARLMMSDAHEHILVYAKNYSSLKFNKVPQSEKQRSVFKNPDNDPRGPWVSTDFSAQGFRPNQMYEVTTPSGRKVKPPTGNCWKNIESVFLQLVADNRIWFGKDGNGVPRRKTFLTESAGVSPWTWWSKEDVGHSQEAKQEIKSLLEGAEKLFDTPKPTRLIGRIIQIATDKNSIILDSFGGSGTTGHATLSQNKEDGGNRRFIMVEMDASICRGITAQRLSRAIQGHKDIQPLGGGFRYCELGDTLFSSEGQIGETVTFKDLAHHVFFIATGEPLAHDSDLKTPLLGIANGTAVYLLYNGILGDNSKKGGNVLTRDILALLPPHKGTRIIYGNGCLISQERLRRENIIFRQVPYEVRVS